MKMDLRRRLTLDEGRVSSVYKDSLGFYTIGVGHCVDGKKGCGLPDHIIDALFDHDIKEAEERARIYAPFLDSLVEARRGVLIAMSFQLGHKLGNFKRTLEAIRDEHYAHAAQEMLRSLWARQTPNRAKLYSRIMETGEW